MKCFRKLANWPSSCVTEWKPITHRWGFDQIVMSLQAAALETSSNKRPLTCLKPEDTQLLADIDWVYWVCYLQQRLHKYNTGICSRVEAGLGRFLTKNHREQSEHFLINDYSRVVSFISSSSSGSSSAVDLVLISGITCHQAGSKILLSHTDHI